MFQSTSRYNRFLIHTHAFLQKGGLKSKRHVKRLLQAMRKSGAVQTKPVGKNKNYVYALKNKADGKEAASKAEAASKTEAAPMTLDSGAT